MKPDQITVQNATHKDINALVSLLKQLFAIEKDFTFDEQKHKKGLKLMLDGCGKHRTVKVAIYNGAIAGMCTAQMRISTASGEMTAVLEDLVVDESARGNGIGHALLEAMDDWAKFMGISQLSLLADKDNTAGLRFYKCHGWEITNLICLSKRWRPEAGD